MSERIYTKNKLGMEDLVQTESEEQTRGEDLVQISGVFGTTIYVDSTKVTTITAKIAALESRILALENP